MATGLLLVKKWPLYTDPKEPYPSRFYDRKNWPAGVVMIELEYMLLLAQTVNILYFLFFIDSISYRNPSNNSMKNHNNMVQNGL